MEHLPQRVPRLHRGSTRRGGAHVRTEKGRSKPGEPGSKAKAKAADGSCGAPRGPQLRPGPDEGETYKGWETRLSGRLTSR